MIRSEIIHLSESDLIHSLTTHPSIINEVALYDNTSYSLGLHVGDTLIAVANGTNDRMSTESKVRE